MTTWDFYYGLLRAALTQPDAVPRLQMGLAGVMVAALLTALIAVVNRA